jgi:hypothetical protein
MVARPVTRKCYPNCYPLIRTYRDLDGQLGSVLKTGARKGFRVRIPAPPLAYTALSTFVSCLDGNGFGNKMHLFKPIPST